MQQDPSFIIVDLFCGAGGTTTGFAQAQLDGAGVAKVIACVNHDRKAIKSHWRNHPEVKHFEEDIRTLDLTELCVLVQTYRVLYSNAYLILWASLECTNFSKAKGGQPRDADSRTLADHLDRYILAIDPDYVQIENVVEFMSWGPLDENGKPVSRKNGSEWLRWRREICAHGYYDEWKELNSANFGAYTSRNRLFGVFAKHGLPIAWPIPTHAKVPSKFSMYGDLQRWKPVKEVLDFEEEGESIFTRKKELSDKTLKRIYTGLLRYIAKGDTAFISKYFSGKPSDKNISTEGPAGTIKCKDGQALVQAAFIAQRNSGEPDSKIVDLDGPARTLTATGGNQDLIQAEFLVQTYAANSKGANTFPVNQPGRTITTRDATQLVQPQFLAAYYGNGDNVSSVDRPCPTIPTKDRFGVVSPVCLLKYDSTDKSGKHYPPSLDAPAPVIITQSRLAVIQAEYFIDKHFGASQNQSVEQPAGTVMPNDKHRLIECQPFLMPTNLDNGPRSIEDPAPVITANRKHHYLVNPSWRGNPGSVDEPCCVIVARQDKAPLYFVQVEKGLLSIAVFEGDSPIMIKIKEFMAVFGLVDIKMRMLRVNELLRIQGFPEGYLLEGNQSDQKKFIGNSVVPHVVKCWTEAMAMRIGENDKVKIA